MAAGGPRYGRGGGRAVLQGGSGGGGGGGGTTTGASGAGGAGGAGGGAIRLQAAGNITISGSITADGGDGSGFRRTGGGGSGGMIALTAGGTVALHADARLSVRGGKGGDCAWMGATGGGGGGGRIVLASELLTISGVAQKPGPLANSMGLAAAGGSGGYYAVDAVNNASPGDDGTVFFERAK